MKTLRRYQTKAHDAHRGLSLIGSGAQIFEETGHQSCQLHKECASSPYFQRSDFEEEAPDQEYQIISDLMVKAFYLGYEPAPGALGVQVYIIDTVNTYNTGDYVVPLSVGASDTDATIAASVPSTVASYFLAAPYSFAIDAAEWAIQTLPPSAPSSYQTIVSQTGTSAPTTAGTVNTYAGAPTFTWARTGAGVYTLTASAAVFTAGKTGIVLGSLNNLNASYKTVVTSSTVVTITTAIGSLLGLGLLGLTATNTDALLTATDVTVKTYA